MAVAPGNPKDHFSSRRETLPAVRPAASAGWNRELERSPQPVHTGPLRSLTAGWLGQALGILFMAPASEVSSLRPPIYSASRTLSVSLCALALFVLLLVVLVSVLCSGVIVFFV